MSKRALIPFFVAGDPDYKTSIEIIKKILPYADLLEIGFPYSDPLADGPTLQASHDRALKSGMNTGKAFKLIEKIRQLTDIPIIAMVYANLVYQKGIENFYKRAKQCGADGILLPDVPPEELKPYLLAAEKFELRQIFMITPSTDGKRLKKILKKARGYIYLVSVLGVTGERSKISSGASALIKRVKSKTALPVALGFGISKAGQVRRLKKTGVHGFIIGSAFAKIIEADLKHKPRLLREIAEFAASIKKSC